MKRVLEHLHEERQRDLEIFSLEKRRLGRDLTNTYKYLMGRSQVDRSRLFSVVPSDTARGNRHTNWNARISI